MSEPTPSNFNCSGTMAMLAVRDAAGALEFYKRAFGARETFRLTEPGGKVSHAEFLVGEARFMLAEEDPRYNYSPQSLGGSTVVNHLYVSDVDAFAQQAVEAGGKMVFPISDQFYGERAGRLEDPYGHQWGLAMIIEAVSVEEMQRRFAAMFEG